MFCEAGGHACEALDLRRPHDGGSNIATDGFGNAVVAGVVATRSGNAVVAGVVATRSGNAVVAGVVATRSGNAVVAAASRRLPWWLQRGSDVRA